LASKLNVEFQYAALDEFTTFIPSNDNFEL